MLNGLTLMSGGALRVELFGLAKFGVNRYILRLNLQLNKAGNVQIEDAALSDGNRIAPLFLQRATGATGSLNPLHYGFKYDSTIPVMVKKLDNFEITKVDVLKIDAEGNELRILRGASQTIACERPIIAVEVHEPRKPYRSICKCETCEYLISLVYHVTILGEYTATPAHWVFAKPIDPRSNS